MLLEPFLTALATPLPISLSRNLLITWQPFSFTGLTPLSEPQRRRTGQQRDPGAPSIASIANTGLNLFEIMHLARILYSQL